MERIDRGLLKLAIDGRDIPNYLDASEALEVSVEINSHERVLVMEVQGTVKIKVRAVSPIREAIEEFLRKQGGLAQATDAVYAAVVASTGDSPSREAILKHLRSLVTQGVVVGEVIGNRGGKGWRWVVS